MLDTHTITCPYCGESIELTIDVSGGSQHYIEDCQVCCRPIEMSLNVLSGGEFQIHVATADDV